jgi:hypothetical protein
MRARTFLVIAVVVATGVVATAGYAHTRAFASKVKITSGGPAGAQGTVGSAKAKCKAGRTVKLFMKTSAGRQLIGTDVTDANGRWRVDASLTEGDYHAVVTRKTISGPGHRHTCKKDRSLRVHL